MSAMSHFKCHYVRTLGRHTGASSPLPERSCRGAGSAVPADTRAGPANEETSMRSTRRSLQALVAVTSATVALAACSSQGGAQNEGVDAGQEFTIAMVTHEAPGDTFWDKIRNGAEQAAEDHGISRNYSNTTA